MSLLIELSPRDLKRGKLVSEPGWFAIKVNSIVAEAGKNDTTNYFCEAEVLKNLDNGSENDKEIPLRFILFNSNYPGFVVPFLTAVNGGKELTPGRVDLKGAEGAVIGAFVKHKLHEGRTIHDVNEFRAL